MGTSPPVTGWTSNASFTCSIVAPLEGDLVGKGSVVPIRVEATDAYCGLNKIDVYVRRYDAEEWSLKGTCASSPCVVNWDTAAAGSQPGQHYIRAVAWSLAQPPRHKASDIGVVLCEPDIDFPFFNDDHEETIGEFPHHNIDDDNLNSTQDKQETGPITGENDLQPISLAIKPEGLDRGVVKLARRSSSVRVWRSSTKGAGNEILVEQDSKTWDLADPAQRAEFWDLCERLRAEGCDSGAAYLDLKLLWRGEAVATDTVKCTFIAAECGRQPTPDERQQIESDFPEIVHCEWSITGEETDAYNCIAWSVDETTWWYNKVSSIPGTNVIGIDEEFGNQNGRWEVEEDLDSFYLTKKGYSPTASGPSDAQVMYYNGYHAARRTGCGCGAGQWIMYGSKLGAWLRVEHAYDQLDDSTYGARTRYYK